MRGTGRESLGIVEAHEPIDNDLNGLENELKIGVYICQSGLTGSVGTWKAIEPADKDHDPTDLNESP